MADSLFVKRIFGIYDFVAHYRQQYGDAPALGEIAAAVKVNTRTVKEYLGKMDAMGMIEWNAERSRSIRLLNRTPNWNALVTPEQGEMPPIRVQVPLMPMQNYRYERVTRRKSSAQK